MNKGTHLHPLVGPTPSLCIYKDPFYVCTVIPLYLRKKEEQDIVEICGVHTPQLFPRLPIANP